MIPMNKVFVKKRIVDTTEKCWYHNCESPVEHYVVRTEGRNNMICACCQNHMLETYRCAVDYMFKMKTNRLIRIAQKHGLTDIQFIKMYLSQQGIEDITLDDIKKEVEKNVR